MMCIRISYITCVLYSYSYDVFVSKPLFGIDNYVLAPVKGEIRKYVYYQ